jgi:hypothetical protein
MPVKLIVGLFCDFNSRSLLNFFLLYKKTANNRGGPGMHASKVNSRSLLRLKWPISRSLLTLVHTAGVPRIVGLFFSLVGLF